MSGPREPRHPRPEDTTVEVPLRSSRSTEPPATEEPWWKNANSRVRPPPPPMPAPPPTPKPPQNRPPRHDRPPIPAGSRHAKAASARRTNGQFALLIGAGVIAIGAAAVGLTVGLSKFDVLTGKVLDVSKAEVGVQRVLLDREVGYSATNVSDVDCNKGNDPAIKKGATFTCDVVVDGRKRQVLVLFTDDDGTYEVDRPR